MEALLGEVANASGVALYAAFTFAIVEAVKQFITENHKRILPIVSIVAGMCIVALPAVLASSFDKVLFVESLYRGGLIGATVTGLVAWRRNEVAPKPPTP